MTTENWYDITEYNGHYFYGYYLSDLGRVAKTMSVCPECTGRKPGRTILREEMCEDEESDLYLEFYYTLRDKTGKLVEIPSEFLQRLLEDEAAQESADTLDPEHPDYF